MAEKFKNGNIREILDKLQGKLQKGEINKTKVQKCSEWLKRNSKLNIPSIVQIVTAYLFGGG